MKYFSKVIQEMGVKGTATTVLLFVIAALLTAILFNPAQEAVDHVGEPIAQDIGIISAACPSGWQDVGISNDRIDVDVKSCARTVDGVEWRVILNEDGSFSHCWAANVESVDFIFDAKDCPKWPID